MSKTMRDSTPEVESWVQTTMALIEASSTYAESGQYDAATDGMIRRIRVATSALQAALMSINIMPPSPTMAAPAALANGGASGAGGGASGAPEIEAASGASGAAVPRPTTRRGS